VLRGGDHSVVRHYKKGDMVARGSIFVMVVLRLVRNIRPGNLLSCRAIAALAGMRRTTCTADNNEAPVNLFHLHLRDCPVDPRLPPFRIWLSLAPSHPFTTYRPVKDKRISRQACVYFIGVYLAHIAFQRNKSQLTGGGFL
jgi:hypothetical protein